MSEFTFPTEEGFVKSAMTEINECSEVVGEGHPLEDLLWNNTFDLLHPVHELSKKFHQVNFSGCHILTEELEDEKCVAWGDWIECVVFFHDTGSMNRVESECRLLWRWMADTSLRYLDKAMISMDNEPHDWG